MTVVFKRLALLFTYQCLISNVYSASNSRQLDIPAMKAFFSDPASHEGKITDASTIALLEPEVLKGPSYVIPQKRQTKQFFQRANLVPERGGARFLEGTALNPQNKYAGTGYGAGNQVSAGFKDVSAPTLSITPLADLSSPRIYQAHSPKPLKTYQAPHNIPTTFSYENQLKGPSAVAHAYPNQGFVNRNRIPIKQSDDEWIPIRNPHERLPVVPSNYKPVISKPIKSGGIPFKAPISNYGTSTLYRGALKNKKVPYGVSPVAQLGEIAHGHHPVHHGPFRPIHTGLSGSGYSVSSYGQPSGSLVGQVLINHQKYVSNVPIRTPPKSNEQVIFTGQDLKSPLSQYELNKVRLTGPSKPLDGFHSGGLANQNLDGLGENKHVNGPGLGVDNPISTRPQSHVGIIPPALVPLPISKEVHNYGVKDNLSPFKANGPNGHQSKDSVNNSAQTPQLLLNNFEDGFTDDVGSVSSFSYFRQLELSKGFDDDFNVNAGRTIAKQFHQQMFDHTGFPGNKIRKIAVKKEDTNIADKLQVEKKKTHSNNSEQKKIPLTYRHGRRT